MRITAVVNQKGGVGKTTTTVNIGAALARDGQRVIVVDLDPQGHLTDALKLPSGTPPATLAAALTGEYTGDAAALLIMYEGAGGRLAAIPNALDMFTVGRELDRLRAREERLGRILAQLADLCDHVLIDCPPALDVLTDNALSAADGVLIPVQAEDSSLRALRLLLGQIAAIEGELRREPLVLHGLVVSMLERGGGGVARSKLGRSVIEQFRELDLPILGTVPRSVLHVEAWRLGKTMVEYEPGGEHAQVYRALAKVLEASE
jgi:chromosome partitioning protein